MAGEIIPISQLKNRISLLDPAEPYVWRLHLSAGEYARLDSLIRESIQENEGKRNHLLTKEYALIVIIYMAEWYKRMYCGADHRKAGCAVEFATHELKRLWESSGIDVDKYVYRAESGSRLWQYSIFVLGGLAIRHELARHDKRRFLKALCRVYHGEGCTLESLEEAGRAVAFRQSITRKHSLYEYLREVLNGNYTTDDEQTGRLLCRIKTANDEVLRSKFRLEWIVNYIPAAGTMTRKLRVWLNSEEAGGTLHQYLCFDRVHLWGINRPEETKWLHFGLRWWNGTQIIFDLNKRKPLISYANTGSGNGFISLGVDTYASCTAIPVMKFTRIEIIAFDDVGNEYVVQTEEAAAWVQLWRTALWKDEWSSRPVVQHQTAVVYTDAWTADREPDGRRPFKNGFSGNSEAWNWCYIYSSVSLTDSRGVTVTLYNRIGYDQVYARLYTSTIRYQEGGFVRHIVKDEEEGETVELFPLIFGKNDIRVHHFQTKDAILDALPGQEVEAEKVEFKTEGGRYAVWTEHEAPAGGLITLRISVKGAAHILKMFYLPGTIERDFEQTAIHYSTVQGERQTYRDDIPLDKLPLEATIRLRIDEIEVDVYRPTLIKEIYLDGAVLAYNQGDTHTTLPYILKNRVKTADFSREGYRVYDCKELNSVFPLAGENEGAALACWDEGTRWEATRLDTNAPAWLNVSIGNKNDADKTGLSFYVWNFYSDDEPQEAPYDLSSVGKGIILFQDMRHPCEQMINIAPRIGRPDPFGTKKLRGVEFRCYLVACKYSLYFMAFEPLRRMVSRKCIREKLLNPLLESRQGRLNEEDNVNLLRFVDEFHLNIDDWKIDIEN